MILPYGEYDSTPSPPRHARRGLPAEEWDDTRQSDMHFSVGDSRLHMGLMTPTTPIIYGNGTMLSDIGEVTEAESTPGRRLPGPAERRLLKQQQASGHNTPLGSSPTMGYAAVIKRTKTGTHQRQVSVESNSTVTSEGQAAEIFKDFDDGVSVDESAFQGDDEESVADSYSEQVIASETQRLSMSDLENENGRAGDRNSSAALSKRAEEILSNAKRRLNVSTFDLPKYTDADKRSQNMEGNLTRARSLYMTPSGSMSSVLSSSPLTRSTPSPPTPTQTGFPITMPPSKQRQMRNANDSPATSPGHARVSSENSALSPQRTAAFPIPFPVRSASAASRFIGRNDESKRSPPLTQAPEPPGDNSRAMSRSRTSPAMLSPQIPEVLEPLGEDSIPEFDADRASIRSSVDFDGEHRGLTRSTSTMQMRDLKDQMTDLKGRLSVLRDRARDDTMKRRSLQSLRTPSPFTAAEQWYSSSKNYGDPLSADAGVASPPWNGPMDNEEEDMSETRKKHISGELLEYVASDDDDSVYEDVLEENDNSSDTFHNFSRPTHVDPIWKITQDEQPDEEESQLFDNESFADYNEEMVEHENAEEYESDASLYHDSLTTPISHEDREDAFDYEHFFLHSAMGTISQQRMERRQSSGSISSEDSVETVHARPATSTAAPLRASLGHSRSESTDTVSTMATFATATEGLGSDEGDLDEGRDTFAVQQVNAMPPRSNTSTPLTARRANFRSESQQELPSNMRASPEKRPSSSGHDQAQRNSTNAHRPSIGSFESYNSNGTTRSFPLVNKPKALLNAKNTPDFGISKEIGTSLSDTMTLTDSLNGDQLASSPVNMLAKEDQMLVERLVASLGKCVLGLQDEGRSTYEGRVFRRRLDAARRVLEGQEGAI